MKQNSNFAQGIHAGNNIKRLREILGIKQEALAICLGTEWNQQRISLLEKRKDIDINLLEQICDALKVPIEALINVDEQKLLNIITNDSRPEVHRYNGMITFDPLQKWLDALEENKRLTRKLLKAKKKLIKCLLNEIVYQRQ